MGILRAIKIINVNRNLESIDNSIKNVMTELRVMNNPKVATEHEEFIANLNRKVGNPVNNTDMQQIDVLNRFVYFLVAEMSTALFIES